MKKNKMVTWIGPNGFNPRVGTVVQGQTLWITQNDYDYFLEQKLVESIGHNVPKKSNQGHKTCLKRKRLKGEENIPF
jgi:hypothetical protein